MLTPARIQLRIPNARYDALYVVAAFNGEKERIPTLSALFFQPEAGFAMSFETQVPGALMKASATATPLPVKLENGKSANLWLVKIPIDPAKLTSFSGLETLEVELTKNVKQYRAYPDPFTYGWHGAGMASGVQVYAVTLHKPDVDMGLDSTVFGHVWTDPNVPSYKVTLNSRATAAKAVSLTVETTSYDGQEKTKQEQKVTVPANGMLPVTFNVPVKKKRHP